MYRILVWCILISFSAQRYMFRSQRWNIIDALLNFRKRQLFSRVMSFINALIWVRHLGLKNTSKNSKIIPSVLAAISDFNSNTLSMRCYHFHARKIVPLSISRYPKTVNSCSELFKDQEKFQFLDIFVNGGSSYYLFHAWTASAFLFFIVGT